MFRDLDLAEANARWKHPWHLVHRGALHDALAAAATSDHGTGTPVKLLPHHRVVDVDPQLGAATLDDGATMTADVVLGADGIAASPRRLSVQHPMLC
jgi:2-polyprenyl-6-methoxyphenol hydroxylase-like FAD-dependent oxidoreductase